MNEDLEFEILKSLRGSAYDTERQRWRTTSVPNKSWLAAREPSADWQTAVTARILLGWSEHGQAYDDLLSMLDAEDVQAAGRTVAGVNLIWDKYQRLAATKYKTDILPLCWEVILKHSSDWPQWKVITFLRMMRAVPYEKSLEPLLWYIQNEEDDAVAYNASQALAQLPQSIVAPRLEKAANMNVRVRKRLETVSEELRRQPPRP